MSDDDKNSSSTIEVAKTKNESTIEKHKNNLRTSSEFIDLQEQSDIRIRNFLKTLNMSSEKFDAKCKESFCRIMEYTINCKRIRYSSVTSYIYSCFEKQSQSDLPATMKTNMDALISYSETNEAEKQLKELRQTLNADIKNNNGKIKSNAEIMDDVRHNLDKIDDHIVLACQQYDMFTKTEADYDREFKRRIGEYEKHINAQMITMVSIFTALAFLIFGSISSLDELFDGLTVPVFKATTLSIAWGIAIANMIFVFLYCIEKMTTLNFKTVQDDNVSILKQYPIVWWTNLILVGMFLVSSLCYFAQRSEVLQWMYRHSDQVVLYGAILIGVLIGVLTVLLVERTKNTKDPFQ